MYEKLWKMYENYEKCMENYGKCRGIMKNIEKL